MRSKISKSSNFSNFLCRLKCNQLHLLVPFKMQLDIGKVRFLILVKVKALITPLIIMRNFLEKCN